MEMNTSPMKGQWANPKTIMCKDCIHRNRDTVEINGKTIQTGITKAFCDMYVGPPIDNGKPLDILFMNKKCEYYEQE